MKKLLVSLLCFLFIGCSYKYVPYQPSEISNIENPKNLIKSVLREQPHIAAFGGIDVTNDYITTSALYYDDIGYVRMYKKDDIYVLKIFDNKSVGKLIIVTYDESEAKAFVDSLAAMGCTFFN